MVSEARGVSSGRQAKFGTTIPGVRAKLDPLDARNQLSVIPAAAVSEATAKKATTDHAQAL